MTDKEWEVVVYPPMTVTADGEQQAADEALRLTLEEPADQSDRDVKAWVRLAGSDDPWVMVHPNLPPLDALPGAGT